MELKLLIANTSKGSDCVLIVPYGIETYEGVI